MECLVAHHPPELDKRGPAVDQTSGFHQKVKAAGALSPGPALAHREHTVLEDLDARVARLAPPRSGDPHPRRRHEQQLLGEPAQEEPALKSRVVMAAPALQGRAIVYGSAQAQANLELLTAGTQGPRLTSKVTDTGGQVWYFTVGDDLSEGFQMVATPCGGAANLRINTLVTALAGAQGELARVRGLRTLFVLALETSK